MLIIYGTLYSNNLNERCPEWESTLIKFKLVLNINNKINNHEIFFNKNDCMAIKQYIEYD